MAGALLLSSLLLASEASVGLSGPPELFAYWFTPTRLYESLADYEEQTYWYPADVPIHQWPEALDAGAQYGIVRIGLQRRVFVLTAWPHVLIADLDGDGSLADEERLPLSLESGGPVELLSTVLAGDRPGLPMKLAFPLHDGKPGRKAFEYAYTLRRGEIRVGERAVAFALVGCEGVYGDPHNPVFFDVDGDGQLAIIDAQDPERFLVEAGRVNIDGRGYAFSVDPIGDSVTLTPLEEWVPLRSALGPGSPAVPFSFVDIDFVPGSLEEYRGRVVLLYFYWVGCAPCHALRPILADLHDAFHAAGFEILAVNTSDPVDVIREYLEQYPVPGRQIPEGDHGPLKELYRVQGAPTWFVIDRDGRIAGRSFYGGAGTPVEDVRELFRALPAEP